MGAAFARLRFGAAEAQRGGGSDKEGEAISSIVDRARSLESCQLAAGPGFGRETVPGWKRRYYVVGQ